MSMTFTFPWPTKMLNPNTPGHWAAKALAKKAYRTACRRIVEETEGHMPAMGPDDVLRVSMRFYPPNKRDRDWDNLMASMKSGLDGLADGLGVNDSLFRPAVEVDSQIGGFVRVTVEVI
jgi:crossover junction endodeoxyribonuclease RusA